MVEGCYPAVPTFSSTADTRNDWGSQGRGPVTAGLRRKAEHTKHPVTDRGAESPWKPTQIHLQEVLSLKIFIPKQPTKYIK